MTIQGVRNLFRELFVCIQRLGIRAGALFLLANVQRKLGGDERTIYRVPLTGTKYPVTLRGGRSDFVILTQIFIDDEYGPLRSLNPKSIVDLGANIGLASIWFLNRFPEARTVAIEANPDNFNSVSTNLKPYGDRAKLILGAVWSKRTDLTVVRRESASDAQVRESMDTDNAADRIKGWDIPSLMEAGGFRTIDILKIDIEGAEVELFRNNTEGWLPLTKNICIELHGPECEAAFFKALQDYDFEQSTSGELTLCKNLKRKPSHQITPTQTAQG
jgi:FkbM family methyltransferase